MPPLRDRADDVPFLAEKFMHRLSRKHGVKVTGISPSCHAALRSHSWPGNVRELQNVIERAVILASDGEDLQTEHLGFQPMVMAPAAAGTSTVSTASAAQPAVSAASSPKTPSEILPLAELEKRQILLALEACGGNRTLAAKHLDISIRTLRNKLHEYGVPSKGGESEPEES